MIKIAKLDPNNKVLGVYLMSDSACRDKNTGEIKRITIEEFYKSQRRENK